MSALITRLGHVDAPLGATYDDLSVAWAALSGTMASGVVASITVDDTSLFHQTLQFNVEIGLRDATTTILSNREILRVYVTGATTLAVVSRSDNSRTHAIGEGLRQSLTNDDMLNNPGPLTSAGSIPYLAASGNMAELLAGADRAFVVYSSGLPIARAIQAADIPDLSASYVPLSATIAINRGGTGQVTATAAFDALSPLSTLGDLPYHDGSHVVRLAGQITSTKKFLRQTGTGSGSAAPAWDTIVAGDIPDLSATYSPLAGSASLVTVGTLTAGTWNASVIPGLYGGTGVANNGKTVTLSGNLTTTGAFNPTFAIPSSSTWTYPSGGGTLLTTAGSGASLTFPGSLSIASGKTLTASNTLTIVATDGITMTTPTSSFTAARTDATNTFSGSQGIGVSPGVTFDVKGAHVSGIGMARFQGSSNLGLVSIDTATTSAGGVAAFRMKYGGTTKAEFGYDNDSDSAYFSAVVSIPVTFFTANVERARITSNGKMGIGLTSPSQLLTLNSTGMLAFDNGSGTADAMVGRFTANTVGQWNGSVAQTFNVGNTITTPLTAGEWFTIDWQTTADVVNLQAVRGSSSGTARVMTLSYGGLKASPVAAITIPITSGNIVFGGGLTLPEAGNLVIGTTTGSQFGTSTTQKLGWWAATPVVQPTTSVAAATFVANTSLIANDTATFDGYTIGQMVKALRTVGLLA